MPFRIDRYSLTTVPLEQRFNEQPLGNATGFIWKLQGKFYLVTNWHVITCRRFPTKENLLKHGGRPNNFRARFNIRQQDFGKVEVSIPVRDDDGNPLWFVHPARNADIVVLPLPYDGNEVAFNLHPINAVSDPNLFVGVGMDVFILGYPFGDAPPAYPVWKRGSIASEPELARITTDYMLVDTSSRPGMSGAPVITRSWSHHLYDDGSFSVDGAAASKFVGIYSGRLHTRFRDEAQIGMVWSPFLIDEIIIGHMRDTD
jgi:hypothetical protein